MLHQLSYQANWEQVITWGDYKPVEVEIDDDNTGIFHAIELQIGINEFDHCSFLIAAAAAARKAQPPAQSSSLFLYL